MNLEFYTKPFKLCKHSLWVYDAKNNFVFEFEGEFDKQGNYIEGYLDLLDNIMFSLNSIDKEPIKDLKLELKNEIELYKDDKLFILIRGWGNLTGIGGYNFSGEKASKIQDDFVKYLMYKLIE